MIKVKSIQKEFPLEKNFMGRTLKRVYALNNISIEFPSHKITGIVGESGCGKSTLARVLCGIHQPDNGSFSWNQLNSEQMKSASWKEYRRNVQMVFQDPYSSLNPRMRIRDIILEPLKIHDLDISEQSGKKNSFRKTKNPDMEEKIKNTLASVGLSADALDKFPHEFSGGQRQRIAIARALILQPEVIIFDEAVSALDVSIQAQILNLILDLQKEFNMTCLFIAHDLSVVSYVSEYIAVMYGGRVVEFNTTENIFFSPRHPYTKLLLASIPRANMKKITVAAASEAVINVNTEGCPFYYRCPSGSGICEKTYPERTSTQEGFFYECFHPENAEDSKIKK